MADQNKAVTVKAKKFKSCGTDGAPQYEEISVSCQAGMASAIKSILDGQAELEGQQCGAKAEAVVTIPEWWAVRPGADRPQMIFLMAEEPRPGGKLTKSRWQIAIPHYNRPKGYKPNIPAYTRGNVRGTLVLTDNSKIYVNASTATEAKRVLNSLKILVPAAMRTGKDGKAIAVKIVENPNDNMRAARVVAMRGSFFSTGQRNITPDWVVELRK